MKHYEEPNLNVLLPLTAPIMVESSQKDLDIPVVGEDGSDPFTE